MWVHGKNTMIVNERCIYEKTIFIACAYYLSSMKICVTHLPRSKRDNSYIYQTKGQIWPLSYLMPQMFPKSHNLFFIYILPPYLHTDFVREGIDFWSKFCPVCKQCSLTIHIYLVIHSPGLHAASQQRHGLIFLIIFMSGWRVYLSWRDLPCLPNLGLFFLEVSQSWRRNCLM